MRAGMTQSGQGYCRVGRSVSAPECTFPRMVAWEVVSWDPGEYLSRIDASRGVIHGGPSTNAFKI